MGRRSHFFTNDSWLSLLEAPPRSLPNSPHILLLHLSTGLSAVFPALFMFACAYGSPGDIANLQIGTQEVQVGLRSCIAKKLPGAAPLLMRGPQVAGFVGEQPVSAQAPLRSFSSCSGLLFCLRAAKGEWLVSNSFTSCL